MPPIPTSEPACCATGGGPPACAGCGRCSTTQARRPGWRRALLDHGFEVHGQVVVCPGINDGPVLDDTLPGVLDRFPELATVCVVPLGLSRYAPDNGAMRAHSPA